MSVISSLILQRLAPAITAFVLFLNSVAGLFGAAPVIPYNPERTDVVVSGEVTTDVNEILGYYNAAVKKTNKSFVIGSSSFELIGTPEIIVDGESNSNEFLDIYWETLEETTSTFFKAPGNGEVIAADVESAKMSVSDGKRYIIIDIVDVEGNTHDTAIERVYGSSVDTPEALGYLYDINEAKISMTYTDNTVSCVIDDNSGKIIYGDWDSTGALVMTDFTFNSSDISIKFDKMAFTIATHNDI